MDAENRKLAGALFHTLRSVYRDDSRKAEKYRWEKIYAAFMKRARYLEAERRFYEKLARWDWERQWG